MYSPAGRQAHDCLLSALGTPGAVRNFGKNSSSVGSQSVLTHPRQEWCLKLLLQPCCMLRAGEGRQHCQVSEKHRVRAGHCPNPGHPRSPAKPLLARLRTVLHLSWNEKHTQRQSGAEPGNASKGRRGSEVTLQLAAALQSPQHRASPAGL